MMIKTVSRKLKGDDMYFPPPEPKSDDFTEAEKNLLYFVKRMRPDEEYRLHLDNGTLKVSSYIKSVHRESMDIKGYPHA